VPSRPGGGRARGWRPVLFLRGLGWGLPVRVHPVSIPPLTRSAPLMVLPTLSLVADALQARRRAGPGHDGLSSRLKSGEINPGSSVLARSMLVVVDIGQPSRLNKFMVTAKAPEWQHREEVVRRNIPTLGKPGFEPGGGQRRAQAW
jgi:hypothetical protein